MGWELGSLGGWKPGEKREGRKLGSNSIFEVVGSQRDKKKILQYCEYFTTDKSLVMEATT